VLVHRVFASLQRLLPRRVSRSLRSIGTAFLAPFYFAHKTGHFRSSLRSKALDEKGAPIPWYTYPAIELLRNKSFREKSILEFGAGQSTLWWAQQARHVTSFEDNAEWYQYLQPQLPQNTRVHLIDDRLSNFETLLSPADRFDVIVIDGLDRFIAAAKSLELLAPGGFFILDNSEGWWGPIGTFPIMDLFRDAGYARVDLYGFSPGNILPHCTSFFFRGSCFLFEAADHPVSLGTLDKFRA
jgi:hypothetical protein